TKADFEQLAKYSSVRELTNLWGLSGYANGFSMDDVNWAAGYWSAAASTPSTAIVFHYNKSGYFNPLTEDYKRFGYPVRCVK
ncbi:MAG: hypothetical protein LBU42_01440, partial [Prevotellaceae bacterium]|nr:hypothetical protein [Prevotellaceae bacterium]